MEQGEILRVCRQERRLTLRQIADGILSPASLSRFENGKTQISADSFFEMLNRTHLDWQSFMPEAEGNNFSTSDSIKDAFYLQDYHTLSKIRQEVHEHGFYLEEIYVILCQQNVGEDVSNLEHWLNVATQTIYNTDEWNYTIFQIVNQLPPLISVNSLKSLTDMATKQFMHYRSNENAAVRSWYKEFLTVTETYALRGGDIQMAEKIAKRNEQIKWCGELSLYHRVFKCLLRNAQTGERDFRVVESVLKMLVDTHAKSTLAKVQQLYLPMLKAQGFECGRIPAFKLVKD